MNETEKQRQARQTAREDQVVQYYRNSLATGIQVKQALAKIKKRYGASPKTVYNYLARKHARDIELCKML